jgi:hypothetical protein
MNKLEASEQLFRWIRNAQFGDYSKDSSSWVHSFHQNLWSAASFARPTASISWPKVLRAENLAGNGKATREFLRRSRETEAAARGVTGAIVQVELTENLLIGSLAEDVVQGFVRRRKSSNGTGSLDCRSTVNNDIDMVAAVACVAAVLIVVRRCQHDGEQPPTGFDHLLDSQGLAGIAADIDDLLTTSSYGYGEALAACHKAHLKTKRGTTVGLHEFEQNLWLRVLIVVRNQIEYVRQKDTTYTSVLVEGDLDYASHDDSAIIQFYSLPVDERELEEKPPRIVLQQYCEAHEARLVALKGPHRAARFRFDFMLASMGWQNRIYLIEFKSTQSNTCPKGWPNMIRYEKFLKRFASRDHGTAELRHVSSLVTPSDIDCKCRRLWY